MGNNIQTRAIDSSDEDNIVKALRSDEVWANEYSEDETLEIVRQSVMGLCVDVPPRPTTRRIYALYLADCDALFVQAIDDDGWVWEAGAVRNDGTFVEPDIAGVPREMNHRKS
jgi:hypothetical protein